MTSIEISVLIASLLLIAFIIYYFFGPKQEVAAATNSKNKQIINIVVDSAYTPSEIILKANLPVEIVFDRRDKGDCTDWVIFSDLPTKENLSIKSYLPQGQKTIVNFTPTKPGKYSFSCGMGMVHGQLIIKS